MREGPIEKKFVRDCKKNQLWEIKFNLTTGFPDRALFLPPGDLILIEFKRPVGGVLSSLQGFYKRRFKKWGFIWLKINTMEQVDEVIRISKEGGEFPPRLSV